MALKKFGEKLKCSLQHLSPKSKKCEETLGGDLSPCALPKLATTQQHAIPAPQADCTQCVQLLEHCEDKNACEKQQECQHGQPHIEQLRTEDCQTPSNMRTPELVPPNELVQIPDSTSQIQACGRQCERSYPSWKGSEDIFPSMYYALKVTTRKPIQQSVLLVNPSTNHKSFSLRLSRDSTGSAELEYDAVSIPGDSVKRLTVTITPETDVSDVFIEVLEGDSLYDKIRVQAKVL
ncbi:uncharacterized protein LOC113146757 [Cyclospora cayetanensis]|uniref:Uncharacterized protein LOC113146757 n=1 Tax=Cyclospora cayetanensis TaxID=88456 RepID=A0A6P6RTK6_9EIME|nr:uncharacterized protein LOC113146757 [Cyclospora cayetanensis]